MVKGGVSCKKYLQSRSYYSYLISISLLLVLFGNTPSVLSNPTLTVDVWTNRGGTGTSSDGGTFLVGETVVFYYSVNVNVTRAKLTLYFPDENHTVLLFNGSLKAGTYSDSGTAGFPVGWRRLVFEAWTATNQHAVDEVRYFVRPIRYSYTISVSGLGAHTTGIYLNGVNEGTLAVGQSAVFYSLSGTNKIGVDGAINITNGTRLYCTNQSITVNSDGNYTFQYRRQYYLKISAEPYGWGSTSLNSSWYDAGSTLTITASAATGYSFAGWVGDYRASSPAITIVLNRSMSITAEYRRAVSISCQISRTDVRRLDPITISGRVTPSPGYRVGLAVEFNSPNGTREEVPVVTDSNGNYQLAFSPDVSGSWGISVGWNGDDNFGPAKSDVTTLMVRPKTYAITISANIVTDQISLRVDGGIVNASSLPRNYNWEEYSEHNISVDEFFYYGEGNVRRFRFEKWGDGTDQLEKVLSIEGDANASAAFIAQYFLNVSSEFGNRTGEGWYDSGSQVNAGIDRREVAAEDAFHVYVFTGWSGDASGTGLTSDPMTMNGPKTAMAVWEKRPSTAFYIAIGAGLSLLVVVAALIILLKGNHARRKESEKSKKDNRQKK